MKQVDFKEMDVSELVARFAEIGVAQDAALLEGQISKFKSLFDQMDGVSQELKRRDGDERRALVSLFSFPNMQVRLKAAKHALAVMPREARDQIQAIADSRWFPQAGEAGMCLVFLDDGTFKPT